MYSIIIIKYTKKNKFLKQTFLINFFINITIAFAKKNIYVWRMYNTNNDKTNTKHKKAQKRSYDLHVVNLIFSIVIINNKFLR